MKRVRVDELIDTAALARDGHAPTSADIRRALPHGWVLDDDGEHAIHDRRVFFGRSWVLICGLVFFGAAALGLFASTLPKGPRAVTRVVLLVTAFVLIGGVVGPLITRALQRR